MDNKGILLLLSLNCRCQFGEEIEMDNKGILLLLSLYCRCQFGEEM